jgi:molecular chaperone DnaK (HSP70)
VRQAREEAVRQAGHVGGPKVPVQGGAIALAVGLETSGGVFTPLLQRGTATPCARTEVFTTAEDNQEAIQVRVFQGEGPRVVDGQRLGSYEVRPLDRAPRGVLLIHVTFQVDAGGTFRLTAKDDAGNDVPIAKLGNEQECFIAGAISALDEIKKHGHILLAGAVIVDQFVGIGPVIEQHFQR